VTLCVLSVILHSDFFILDFSACPCLRGDSPRPDYNGTVKPLLKSLAAALVGMAVFFCFFMMLSVPLLMIVSRLRHASDLVLAPTAWFRSVGLPLSAAAFVICFLLAMKKFRKGSSQPSALSRQ